MATVLAFLAASPVLDQTVALSYLYRNKPGNPKKEQEKEEGLDRKPLSSRNVY